jgi:selenoprotein W-related protein
MAQELLTTFQDEIGEVALLPGKGGIFEIHVDAHRIWSRAEDGGFPDIKDLKQRVRDRVAPAKDLGHSERKPPGKHERRDRVRTRGATAR